MNRRPLGRTPLPAGDGPTPAAGLVTDAPDPSTRTLSADNGRPLPSALAEVAAADVVDAHVPDHVADGMIR